MHSLLKKGFCLYVYSLLACCKNIKMDIYIGFSLQIYVIQVRRKPTENLQEIREWHSIYLFNSEL